MEQDKVITVERSLVIDRARIVLCASSDVAWARRGAVKLVALVAITFSHYFWVSLWVKVPPAPLVYAIYAPLYALVVMFCMAADRSWWRMAFRLGLLLFLAILLPLVSIFGAELIYGRAHRWSPAMINSGVLVGLPFKFLAWLHLLVSWATLRMLSRWR
jgi:hypothetical protein